VGRENPATSGLPKSLQNPVKSGMEAPIGGRESEGDGRSSLHARDDLQDIKKCLTVIKDQVDLGLKRVEAAIQSLEQRKCMGCEGMGHNRNTEAAGWLKPKKRNLERILSPSRACWGPSPIRRQPWFHKAQDPRGHSLTDYYHDTRGSRQVKWGSPLRWGLRVQPELTSRCLPALTPANNLRAPRFLNQTFRIR
jgi:hypothetical protein